MPLHDRFDVAVVVVVFTCRLVGESVHVKPVVGAIVTDSVAVPVYPFNPLTVIVVLLVDPVMTEVDEGAAWIVKSRIMTVTMSVLVRLPLVAVMVTV